MVSLLQQIAQNTGSTGDTFVEDIDISGQTADGRMGLIPVRAYDTVETKDLPNDTTGLNDDGSITLQPGDSKDLCRIDHGVPTSVYAVGAVDADHVQSRERLAEETGDELLAVPRLSRSTTNVGYLTPLC